MVLTLWHKILGCSFKVFADISMFLGADVVNYAWKLYWLEVKA